MLIYDPPLRAQKGDNRFTAWTVGGLLLRPWFIGSLRSVGIKIFQGTNGVIWVQYKGYPASLD